MVREQPITLSPDELSSEVAHLLDEYCLAGASQDNRVSAVPDIRTIRYYTSLGLLDRPRMEGRQARYGKRHVLQLLAIKSLQAIGLPLSEIQARMYGLSDAELESLLTSLSRGRQKKKEQQVVRPVIWREVVIEPGLKIAIQEGWSPQVDEATTQEKINAILDALKSAPAGSNGGNINEHDQ